MFLVFSAERDGAMTNLFIHSSHVLSSAEQILLEYLDQPRSKTASKCKFCYFTLPKIILVCAQKKIMFELESGKECQDKLVSLVEC